MWVRLAAGLVLTQTDIEDMRRKLHKEGGRLMFFKYLWYVLKHKWYVLYACMTMRFCDMSGMTVEPISVGFIRGILHDLSKFSFSEYIAYMRKFYDKGSTIKTGRDYTGYYDPANSGSIEFSYAWLHHANHNPHHWQYWVMPNSDGTVMLNAMPIRYVLEMVCDWYGAGKAQKSTLSIPEWYHANKDNLLFHPATRTYLEQQISYYAYLVKQYGVKSDVVQNYHVLDCRVQNFYPAIGYDTRFIPAIKMIAPMSVPSIWYPTKESSDMYE